MNDDNSIRSNFKGLQLIETELIEGKIKHKDYKVKNGKIYRKSCDGWKTVISELEKAKDIAKETHSALGHQNLKDTVFHFCNEKKTNNQNSLRMMRRGQPFEKWGMDFVGPLPPSKSNSTYIVTAIDYGTGWAKAIPIKKQTAFWAIHMVRQITLNHGLPKEITTDNGREFDGNLFGKYLKSLKIQHNQISPYHPQSNGLVERFHGTLLKNLQKLCLKNVNEWDRHLDKALFGYRASRNDSMGASPFFMTYGVSPVVSITTQQYQLNRDYSERTRNIAAFNQARQQAIENLHQKFEDQIKKNENNYVERHFRKGDLVLRSFEQRPSKLHPKWDGPFIIQDCHPNGSYVLMTANGYNLRFPVNGDRLKEYRGNPKTSSLPVMP